MTIDTSAFFDLLFQNSRANSMLIMDIDGVILHLNPAFTETFGYSPKDLENLNFSVLFTEKDRLTNRPEREINNARIQGSASDDNYLLDKQGMPIWVNGETVRVEDARYGTFLVKIVHNIHAQKQLERFLVESNDFLDSIFESIRDTALIILDATMKLVKVNTAFRTMFEVQRPLSEGSNLSAVNHPFWDSEEIRQQIRDVITKNHVMRDAPFELKHSSGQSRPVLMSSLIIFSQTTSERKVLLILEGAELDREFAGGLEFFDDQQGIPDE